MVIVSIPCFWSCRTSKNSFSGPNGCLKVNITNLLMTMTSTATHSDVMQNDIFPNSNHVMNGKMFGIINNRTPDTGVSFENQVKKKTTIKWKWKHSCYAIKLLNQCKNCLLQSMANFPEDFDNERSANVQLSVL